MARRVHVQYPGAIYHLMARGNGRQDIACDDADRDRLVDYLGRAAARCSWRVFAFVIMSNHLHVVLKTPEPNLARGMQGFLSAYANVSARHIVLMAMSFRGVIAQSWWKTNRTCGRSRTTCISILGVSRAESVPNLTRRFGAGCRPIDESVRNWNDLTAKLSQEQGE